MQEDYTRHTQSLTTRTAHMRKQTTNTQRTHTTRMNEAHTIHTHLACLQNSSNLQQAVIKHTQRVQQVHTDHTEKGMTKLTLGIS